MRQSLWGYVFPGFCITGIVIQCDQMDRLFVRYLAICNDEHLPNSIQNLTKYIQKFAKQVLFSFGQNAKDFKFCNFGKRSQNTLTLLMNTLP